MVWHWSLIDIWSWHSWWTDQVTTFSWQIKLLQLVDRSSYYSYLTDQVTTVSWHQVTTISWQIKLLQLVVHVWLIYWRNQENEDIGLNNIVQWFYYKTKYSVLRIVIFFFNEAVKGVWWNFIKQEKKKKFYLLDVLIKRQVFLFHYFALHFAHHQNIGLLLCFPC